jgi:hypothetical protein
MFENIRLFFGKHHSFICVNVSAIKRCFSASAPLKNLFFVLGSHFSMSLEMKTVSGVFQRIFKDNLSTQLVLVATAICAFHFLLR